MNINELVGSKGEVELLKMTCPKIEDELEECECLKLDAHLYSGHPWYIPAINLFYLGGFNTVHVNHLNFDRIKDFDTLKDFIETITKECHLKDYLVFKTCPGCGLELPVIDFRVREDGLCTFCGSKERETTQLTSEKRTEGEK